MGRARAPRHRSRRRVAYVNRSFSKGRLSYPKTEASKRAVPLQSRALAALDQLPREPTGSSLLFPAERGGYLDLHNFRNRNWKPAQIAHRTVPAHLRSQAYVRDLRPACRHLHLRAVALHERSLTMIDRHYGHLARDGREHAIRLLDSLNAPSFVDARWTLRGQQSVRTDNETGR